MFEEECKLRGMREELESLRSLGWLLGEDSVIDVTELEFEIMEGELRLLVARLLEEFYIDKASLCDILQTLLARIAEEGHNLK